MTAKNENANIYSSKELTTPNNLKYKLPITENVNKFVIDSRQIIRDIMDEKDKRLLLVVGPCSIHNIDEAKNYASQLKMIADKVKHTFYIVMRVYFENPRTTVGWKGFIHDPHLDNTFDANHGLYLARQLLLYINSIGLPCGCEFLDVFTPQYIGDLISWGAIGARTTESQLHRQIVSGLSMPIGFKNNRSGNLRIPCDSIVSAHNFSSYLGINENGNSSIFVSKGNPYCHTILTGDDYGPNYKEPFINELIELLDEYNLPKNIMVDCSHRNSSYHCKNQKYVLNNVIMSWLNNNKYIMGLIIKSNINEGKQELRTQNEIRYGISITYGCISIKETEDLLLSTQDLILNMRKKN